MEGLEEGEERPSNAWGRGHETTDVGKERHRKLEGGRRDEIVTAKDRKKKEACKREKKTAR